MPGFNQLTLLGNLTREIETRNLPSGTTVALFAICVNRNFKDRDGQWQEEKMFIDCQAWGHAANYASSRLSKGMLVLLNGKLRLDTWEDKETGDKRRKHIMIVDRIEILEPRKRSGEDAPPPPPPPPNQPPPPPPPPPKDKPWDDTEPENKYPDEVDDIPF